MSFAKEQAIATLDQCIKDARNRYVAASFTSGPRTGVSPAHDALPSVPHPLIDVIANLILPPAKYPKTTASASRVRCASWSTILSKVRVSP